MSSTATEPIAAEPGAAAVRRSAIITGLALGAVWVIWGSTYLAIRFGLETMPPYLMQGCRFSVASLVLFLIVRRRVESRPTRRQLRNAALVGVLLLIGGVGMVTLAEDKGVDSGLIATLIAVQPMLMSLWGGLWGTWPRHAEWVGMTVGLVGVAVLMADSGLEGTSAGIGLVFFACFNWSLGSTLSRRLDMPPGAMATVVEMAAAAVAFMVLSRLTNEELVMPSARSGLALAYLTVFGSVIAFSAFTYLIANVRASLAMSYAYVNPVIAVMLGALLADERLSANLLLALPVILLGVAIVTNAPRLSATPTPRPRAPRTAVQTGVDPSFGIVPKRFLRRSSRFDQ
jgi:drug/metabolite transporter (DMT)-like permease